MAAISDFQVIAKAGWLHRESSILRRWKRNWFVLYTNGQLKYFESPDKYEAEESMLVPTDVEYILTGSQCSSDVPPGISKGCLLAIYNNDGDRLQLCAESPDDASAWVMSLEEARIIHRPHSAPPHGAASYYPNVPSFAPPAYTAVPGSPYMYRTTPQGYHYPPQYTHVNSNGERIVYVYDHRGRRRRGSGDFATGALTGAAVGSLLFWPLLWW